MGGVLVVFVVIMVVSDCVEGMEVVAAVQDFRKRSETSTIAALMSDEELPESSWVEFFRLRGAGSGSRESQGHISSFASKIGGSSIDAAVEGPPGGSLK